MNRALLGLLVTLLIAPAAHAASISLSNEYFEAANVVVVEPTGSPTFSYSVNQIDIEYAGGASDTTDIGYATTSASVAPLSYQASISADGAGITALGFDYVEPEASARYEADLILSGGTGPVDLVIDSNFVFSASNSDPGASTYYGSQHLRILDASSNVLFGSIDQQGAATVTLQYGALYRLQIISNVTTTVHEGYTAAVSRAGTISLSVVPEPGVAGLMAIGILALGLFRRDS